MAYGIGPISGCHVNPAVSFGVYVAGRMSVADMIGYWIAQVLGAIVAAVVLYLILSGKAQGWTGGLGQNGWGAGNFGEYNLVSALVFEVVGTFLFLVCILGVTHPIAPTGFAGLAIGLTLVVIHLVGINITGTSVNPARSIGPALVGIGSNPRAVAQLWLFIIAPLIGAGAAGLLFSHWSHAGRIRTSPEPRIPWLAGICRLRNLMAERGRGCALPPFSRGLINLKSASPA